MLENDQVRPWCIERMHLSFLLDDHLNFFRYERIRWAVAAVIGLDGFRDI